MAIRIFSTKIYLLRTTRGISGFKQWGTYDYYIAPGSIARNHRPDLVGEFHPNGSEVFDWDYGRRDGLDLQAVLTAFNKRERASALIRD